MASDRFSVVSKGICSRSARRSGCNRSYLRSRVLACLIVYGGNNRGGATLTWQSVCGMQGVRNILNVLIVLVIPRDVSLAYRALFYRCCSTRITIVFIMRSFSFPLWFAEFLERHPTFEPPAHIIWHFVFTTVAHMSSFTNLVITMETDNSYD